jgi:hypothetical protein
MHLTEDQIASVQWADPAHELGSSSGAPELPKEPRRTSNVPAAGPVDAPN